MNETEISLLKERMLLALSMPKGDEAFEIRLDQAETAVFCSPLDYEKAKKILDELGL